MSDPRTQLLDLIVDPDSAYNQPLGRPGVRATTGGRRAVPGAPGADSAAREARRGRRHHQDRGLRRPGAAPVRAHGLQVVPAVVLRQGPLGPHAAVAEHALGRRRDRRGCRRRGGRRRLARAPLGRRPRGHRDERVERQVLLPQPHHGGPRHEDPPLQVLVRLALHAARTATTRTSGSGRRAGRTSAVEASSPTPRTGAGRARSSRSPTSRC